MASLFSIARVKYHLFWSYGKCPKISFTKFSDKMACANCADPDLKEQSDQCTLFVISLGILRNSCIESKILAKKVWNKASLNKSCVSPYPTCSVTRGLVSQ